MKIYYDEDGDILEVQFATGKPDNRTGIGITEQITIFCDTSFQNVYGFAALAYSKLLALPELPLDEIKNAPLDVQEKIKKMLSKSPLNHFLHLIDNKVGIEDVRISELVSL